VERRKEENKNKKKGISGLGLGRTGRTGYSRCWILMVWERTSRPVLERRWRTEDRFVDGGGTSCSTLARDGVCSIQVFCIAFHKSFIRHTLLRVLRDTRIMPSHHLNFVLWNQEFRQKSCNPFVMCGGDAARRGPSSSSFNDRISSHQFPASSSVPHILTTRAYSNARPAGATIPPAAPRRPVHPAYGRHLSQKRIANI
jgi:hypothetical protein